MVDSFANVWDALRIMEAGIGSAIDNEPLYNKDVPPPLPFALPQS